MDLALIESNPEMGIVGLKKNEFIKTMMINNDRGENLWICRLTSTKGVFVGYFCSFNNDETEYHLQNDKGTVRVFKTIDAAASFYSDVSEKCLTYVYLGLV